MNKYSVAEKEQIVEEWRISGQTQRQFSLTKGINQHTLKGWAKTAKKACFVEFSIKEKELKASWGTKVIIRTKGIEIEAELESLAKVLEVVVRV